MADDITNGGRNFVTAYQLATERVRLAKRDLDAAHIELHEATNALIKWLSPVDAKPGEKFGIWCRDTDNREVLVEVQTELRGEATEGCATIIQPGTVRIRPRK